MFSKTITYNRDSKDFDALLNGEYIGSFNSHLDAQNALDNAAYSQLVRGVALVADTEPMPEPELVAVAIATITAKVETCQALDDNQRAAYARAIERAAAKLAQGVTFRIEATGYRFPSKSAAEIWHTTTATGCDCRASVEGKACWHRPARAALVIASGLTSKPVAVKESSMSIYSKYGLHPVFDLGMEPDDEPSRVRRLTGIEVLAVQVNAFEGAAERALGKNPRSALGAALIFSWPFLIQRARRVKGQPVAIKRAA